MEDVVGTGTTQSWHGRRVLVTGATGLVGSWLVKDLLGSAAQVVAFVIDPDPMSELYRSGDIDRISVIAGDLQDYRAVERAIVLHEIDTVFHLGAQTIVSAAHRSPLPTFEVNIRGTYNLLEACRVHRDLVRCVVVASSDKAYGELTALPYTEDMPVQAEHPYAVSKSCADLIARAYHLTYGLPISVARCGNVYGGGDLNWSRIVPGTIRSFLRGERPVIRSDGQFVRDYIFVKDVSQAYLRLAEAMDDPGVCGRAFNFSSEAPLTVLEVISEIQTIMDCAHIEPDIRNDAVGEIRSQYLSAARARDALKWSCGFEFRDALAETIEWYRSFVALDAE